MKSIEAGIRGSLLMSLLVSFVILAVLADYGVKQISQRFVATRLQHDADNLIKALQPSSAGDWQVNTQNLPLIYQRVQSGHYYQVQVGDQRLRSRSLWDQQPELQSIKTGQQRLLHAHTQDEHWLVWQQGINKRNQPINLWLAEDIAPLERQWRQFSYLLYGFMTVALVVLLWIQRRQVRKGFSSLDRLRDDIHQLKQGDIASLSQQVPTEIQPLTAEINELLVRLQQRTSRSRTAMGNLAHELKRHLQRLTLMQTNLPEQHQQDFQQVLEEIRRLSDREMKRARIAGDSTPGQHFRPASDLPVMIEILQRTYPSKTVELQQGNLPELAFDRDDMLELVGNLADNACKFCEHQVLVELQQREGQFLLRVSNDGQVFPEPLAPALMTRGSRVDESVEGFGLGLSICKIIVETYQGTLTVNSNSSDSSEYRTQLVVTLPLSLSAS
ncbi:sensor histidine kinase [Motiliproteus coralliicola]|uniref:histidine kinase n=1 Tax=Motiliproteus coralliicola TaxID=2283196 RepID=A0A369WCN4_9GAMM|nr:sensor histidine kinase [Motiliproteus coralliicola]RDE19387.1 sensor histidine kinase [Motiliproteus coralliicola]